MQAGGDRYRWVGVARGAGGSRPAAAHRCPPRRHLNWRGENPPVRNPDEQWHRNNCCIADQAPPRPTGSARPEILLYLTRHNRRHLQTMYENRQFTARLYETRYETRHITVRLHAKNSRASQAKDRLTIERQGNATKKLGAYCIQPYKQHVARPKSP